MTKKSLMSIVLSILTIVLLGAHYLLSAQLGNPDWLNAVFGLPVGMAVALNLSLVFNQRLTETAARK